MEGTFAALPTAGNTGRLYVCTDAGLILRDNRTTWDRIWGGVLGGSTAPPSAGWTTDATFAVDHDSRLQTSPQQLVTIFIMSI
jgi:hypothetical protein